MSTLFAPFAAEAPQPKGYRIGLLIGSSAVFVAPYIETFRQALRELGYVEGQTLAVDLEREN